jgi:hypothetical protein
MEKIKKWLALECANISLILFGISFVNAFLIKQFKFPTSTFYPIFQYSVWFFFGLTIGLHLAIEVVKYLRKQDQKNK